MRGPERVKYLHQSVDRHGNVRIYFWRRPGPMLRIRATLYSAEFWTVYHELLSLSSQGGSNRDSRWRASPAAGTFHWLCVKYFESATFRRLDARGQRVRRSILESICREPTKPEAGLLFGDMPLQHIATKSLRIVRDRKGDLLGAANNRVKALRRLFAWAIEEEHVAQNPARDLLKIKTGNTGHHSWTVEEVARFELCHAIGTKARLALALLLWTGVRRSDVVLLGRQHVQRGWLRFTPKKTKGAPVEIPVLPELQRVIDATPCGDLTFLVNDKFGEPFTANGFGNWFRERCEEAGVPGRAHGLRKAGAATAAENGATSKQLMAIFGWLTLTEAERYTRAAERKKLAGEAMSLLVRKP